MMLALSGRTRDFNGDPVEVEPFLFYLAERLHVSLREVEAMTAHEYLSWHAYFTAKHAAENTRPVSAP